MERAFLAFTGGQSAMDGRTFVKLMKDCGLMDAKLTTTDLDIIFMKVKDKKEKKVTVEQFLNGLREVAAKKGLGLDELQQKVAATPGPQFKGTKPDAVKLHDDKSTYTGVYQHGGPSTVDTDKVIGLNQLTNRAPADVRGTNLK